MHTQGGTKTNEKRERDADSEEVKIAFIIARKEIM